MPSSQGLVFLMIPASFAVLVLLPFVGSSHEPAKLVNSHRNHHQNNHKLSPQLSFQVTLHGFLLWASMGFLMPVGILIIRMSNREECGKRVKVLFYLHVILQIASVLLTTAGAVMSIKNFENSFSNTHQRIGLALYALMWLQPLIGFCRPQRGVRGRSIWYFVHWILGTGVCLLGIINIYTGLQAYRTKTSRSTKLWSCLFSAEVSLIAFLYLFQDRWEYMQKQGVILGGEPITPTDQITSPKHTQKQLAITC
ncbi:cytochrome b561 domain-containing protein At4g18260-like [Magnolia sinica]|uniref:cytochrome b561 domain-containing protein At4g18260-like n=1 Tax=Magnolia sinica TaxID=86752 RepID=UPI002659A7E4|nr:cytochrome b561 domain-containing protein At4g18260-like [Magnolia sinica]